MLSSYLAFIEGRRCCDTNIIIPCGSCILMVWLLHDEKHILTLKGMNLFKFDGKMIRKILHIGVPNGIENSMFQLGKILL